ncbi:hypothetical protein CFK38_10220 [Brachybacterium vulturis]|uniref:DUF4870 domain-containing protein n=1 Tax=Brachybacterium vulturis TaxID=2017484 RepID=A0A291GP95_9MICO|nr:DUF4870 domain-containing protein [Brachybacterium vulturis]ATG51856.1 hypothetical protein CFK38_10220 [Brachybacterium vulturis]
MSQTPHPHDPYAAEPGGPDAPRPPQAEQGAPTSDPNLHPHDPYAYDADADAARNHPLDIDAAPASQPAPQAPAQQPSPGGQAPYAAPAPHAQQAPHGQQAPYGSGPAAQGENLPPAGTPGIYDGPLTGQAVSQSDSRLWATIAQAAVAVGHVVSWGFLGWVGPLVVYLMYKDRDRFVRFHSAEALNGAIAVFAAQIVLTIVITILTIFTFGIATILYPLVGLPALVQLVFSIIGAVKANRGEYWNYPVNLRLVK